MEPLKDSLRAVEADMARSRLVFQWLILLRPLRRRPEDH